MKQHQTTITIAALLLAAGLAACSPSDKTAGQKLDDTVATSERKAAEFKADVKQGASDIKDAAGAAATSVKKTADDAAITTAVNGALVKDSSLSALKIDVDTRDGHVVLSGTAPDAKAKSRATELAMAVTGVQAVDNRLTVQ
jgi:osmotically-inducible protein OsmY